MSNIGISYALKKRSKAGSNGVLKSSEVLKKAADYELDQEASPMSMSSPKVMVSKIMGVGPSRDSDIEASDYQDEKEMHSGGGMDNESMPIDHDMPNDDFLSDESDVDINEHNKQGMLHKILARVMAQHKGR